MCRRFIGQVLPENAWSASFDAFFPDRRRNVHASKKPDAQSLSVFRSIACLPILNKCLTPIIWEKVYAHCEVNSILTEEQKWCHNSRGCKDLITIDSYLCSVSSTCTGHTLIINALFPWCPTVTYLRFSGLTQSPYELKPVFSSKAPSVPYGSV